MNVIEAIIMAIVEGLTEFLPISSTGHMIIASAMMGINEEEFTKIFTVNVQFGAILSVVVLYWRRFFQSFEFYLKLFIAFIPSAIFGLLFIDIIDALLENVVVVAVMLLVGGFVLIFIDRLFNNPENELDQVNHKKAFTIGLFQCLAMIPGVSRSAATIIGGMTQKLSRKAAAEFSFFLAVPTMFAASGYKLLKDYKYITIQNIDTLLIGNVVAFIVAMLAIKFFISFLTKYGFKVFGYYRIALGLLLLILFMMGVDLEV
ncbi:undecaprenyl-diphosphate phosphatase [Rhodocytophaga aerolata]|uniref:Undecaprenyl-diphosphatase n=1 Tax=Rhodocytophaga aerolata TaxID=455078 RepID=A0ABT8RG12_9BACT|nr:undecaprenyl-diphosphate phosphatase [Rhodocytophaga aerolata]MDO1450919.1 undecaprenyl-diphosphate phosphatase [Rhodocytophaga aerolata]